ncbi:MAG: glycosyltransferase family 2 protein [Bacteroidetes bacterium]|nr:glycosyltransferase family 2 protein [Bacteroidota bacterium]
MSATSAPQISFVVPLYNEKESFPMLVQRLNALMDHSPLQIEVVMVDDGSRDNTAVLMQVNALQDARYHCVFLSRNFGHQLALTAGLAAARGTEAVLCIDGDLQDPPELFHDFYKLFQEGYEVVYAIRRNRKEGVFKKAAYHLYYRLLKSIANIDMNLDSGDFALLSRKVLNVMNQLPEESRYLRGMRSWVGFKQIGFEYDRPERQVGETKYSFSMLLRLAYNGIFNFSELPIKFITNMGLLTIAVSLSYFVYTLAKRFVFGIPVIEGFTGLLFTIILFSGVQLVSLGIIGEYVLRIFFQVKGRPLFIVKSRIVNGKVVEESQ